MGQEVGSVPGGFALDVTEAVVDTGRDPHSHFRDLCLLYGDFNRPVFLEAFLEWFVRHASRAELGTLRKEIAARAAEIGEGGKRGRPRSESKSDWLFATRSAAWHRIVEGWTWRKIAESEGMKPDRRNRRTIERTLSRRQDQYAAMIWQALAGAGVWLSGKSVDENLARIEASLQHTRIKRWLLGKAGLPFDLFSQTDRTEGCTKLVLELAPRGWIAAGRELVRRVKYSHRNRG